MTGRARRAGRQIARPFRAIGRGIANVFYALLEALDGSPW